MRISRLHLDGSLTVGQTVRLSTDDSHYLLRVLRLREGDEVRLFNGDSGDWLGNLRVHGKREASVDIVAFKPAQRESHLDLHLVQGVSRGQRMDYTLQKSVELGVTAITPVLMKRTQAPPEGDRLARKQAHWAGVISSAAAQSGRTRLPALQPVTEFPAWLETAQPEPAHPHILLDPDGERLLTELGSTGRITLLAGPEGGFAPEERDAARARGCITVRMGPRILRTETAAVAALAALQVLYGDLGSLTGETSTGV